MGHSRFTEIVATFFYLGRAPIMPGTVGTLGAIPVVFLFSLFGVYGYIAAVFILSLVGMWVADAYETIVQDHDTKDVVIDEVCGYAIAMFWLPHTWQAFLLSFILFRVLDILKPFPINLLDRSVQGGFGVMVDDLVAGIFTNIILQFVYTQTTWLGEKVTWSYFIESARQFFVNV